MKQMAKRWLAILLISVMVLGTVGEAIPAMAVASLTSRERGTSKKGMQITGPHLMHEAVEMGCSSVFVNVYLGDFMSTGWGEVEVKAGTNTYYINMTTLGIFENNFAYAKENGIEKIYVAVYAGKMPGITYAPSNSNAAQYAFNATDANSKKALETIFSTLTKKLGKYVDYWMVGSEINDQKRHWEMGTTDIDKFIKNYEACMRLLNKYVKAVNSKGRVMICLDHEWNSTAESRFNARTLLEKLAALTKSNDYDWGVGIHPYPEPLTSANFWNDNLNAASHHRDTPRITMYNLDVFTDFMQENQMLYNGMVRPVAITECGFSARENGVEDETLQAAAYAYAYYKVEANPLIETFILRCYHDEPAEIAGGFWFGMNKYDSSAPNYTGDRRQLYNVVRYIDTVYGKEYADLYLAYFGVQSWEELVPGYNKLTFKKAPKALTVSSSRTIVLSNQDLKITAKPHGLKAPITYTYKYKMDNQWQEMVLKENSTSSTYSFKMPVAETGKFIVEAKDATGAVVSDYVRLHVSPSTSTSGTTGIVKIGPLEYYMVKGVVDFTYSGLVTDKEGKQHLVESGIKNSDYTGIYFDNGVGRYVENGVVSTNVPDGEYYDAHNWQTYYMKNGVVDKSYTMINVGGWSSYVGGKQVSNWNLSLELPLRTAGYLLKTTCNDEEAVIRFKSHDKSVVTVSKNGKLVPQKRGEADVEIYYTDDWGYTYSETLHVKVTVPFTDVAEDAWYRGAVDYVYKRRIINGTSETTFSPDNKVTRAQIVTMLWNLEGAPKVGTDNLFSDVSKTKYYAPAIAWARQNGIVNGNKDGTFCPNETISRQDLVAILRNYAKYRGGDVSVKNKDCYRVCSDYTKVSGYASTAVAWAYERGFIGANNKLMPQDETPRSQVASMLQRFMQHYQL